MDAREELVLRCAERRREKIGGLSNEGFAELVLAVRKDPLSFVDSPEEQAFAELTLALEEYQRRCADDELLDDQEYQRVRAQRIQALVAACQRAVATDPGCMDARTIGAILSQPDADARLDAMVGLAGDLPRDAAGRAADPWQNVFLRPGLRLRDALARAAMESARYEIARLACEKLLRDSPADALGSRRTLALALARLEDEDGLNALDARYPETGDTWVDFGRAITLYKLGRMTAARRALKGFDRVSTGGAYALLRPVIVEPYLPDRPHTRPGTFQEAIQVMHDAEVIIDDSPGFVEWTQGLDWFVESGRAFAERQGLSW